jgi:NADH-quinone oxidoreductase subunit H
MTPELKGFLLISSFKILAVFTTLQVGVMMVIWAERRVSAWKQGRLGPNRVGPAGLFQSIADGIKNIFKEETWPTEANRTLFLLAPIASFIPAMLTIAVVPIASPLPLSFDFTLPVFGQFAHSGPVPMIIADLPIGLLYVLAVGSLGVYGIVLAGWSSNSKYALLGGLRASAQMVSYEVALGFSVVTILILAGNVTLSEIVQVQQDSVWFILALSLGFVLFYVSALAETNRLPFDMPESESELITGYHTEYSSMKFSMFFIAEYTHIIVGSALIATLFFGGWDIPFTSWDNTNPSVLKTVLTLGAFSLKTLFFIYTFIWIRWTLPRFRFDQLMALGWKFLLPLSLSYVMVIALTVWVLDQIDIGVSTTGGLVLFGLNLIILFITFGVLDRGRIIKGSGYTRVGASWQ